MLIPVDPFFCPVIVSSLNCAGYEVSVTRRSRGKFLELLDIEMSDFVLKRYKVSD